MKRTRTQNVGRWRGRMKKGLRKGRRLDGRIQTKATNEQTGQAKSRQANWEDDCRED